MSEYAGPTKSDVLAVFEKLRERGYGNERASPADLTEMFCELLLERHLERVAIAVSWGYQ